MFNNATSKAKYTFRRAVNGLYMEKKFVDDEIQAFLDAMQTGQVSDLAVLELFANYEFIKSQYPLLAPNPKVDLMERAMVASVRRYLATKSTDVPV